jgi:hypothetical protein
MTKIDYPAHTTQVHFPTAYESKPEANGAHVSYNQWVAGRPSDEEPWSILEYATGSDYSGSLVEVSNYNGLCELLEEHHPDGSEPVVWCRTHGGHGTFGLLVRYELLADEVREAIDALEDYPLLDDEAHSQLECEAQGEAWENWARRDFERALSSAMGVEDFPEMGSDTAHGLFDTAAEAANCYWENQSGGDMYVDIARVVKQCAKLLESDDHCPKWLVGCDFRYECITIARKAFADQLAGEIAAAGTEE